MSTIFWIILVLVIMGAIIYIAKYIFETKTIPTSTIVHEQKTQTVMEELLTEIRQLRKEIEELRRELKE